MLYLEMIIKGMFIPKVNIKNNIYLFKNQISLN